MASAVPPGSRATTSKPRSTFNVKLTASSQRAALVALVIITLLTMIAFDRPLVRGDGIAYFAWVDTLAGDGDVNFNNQHDRFCGSLGQACYQIAWNPTTERWVNIFPFGIAFVQAPFYWIGDWFYQQGWLDFNTDYFRQMQGLELPYSLWLMFGANVLALIAVVLAWQVGRRLLDPWTAALTVFAVFMGTPLFYYSTITPVNSHNPGAFGVACYFYLLVRLTHAFESPPDRTKPARFPWLGWVLLGAAAGVAVLSRWQLLVAVAPGWALIAWERRWRGFLVAGVSAAVTLLPLPLIWNTLFGVPFLVPFDAVSDEAFMQTRNYSVEVLRETLLHSPIVLLSLIGVAALWRVSRAWALLLGTVIALQVIVNGSALDWNAGQSYGMRRMSELYLVYALLACAALRACGLLLRRWNLRPAWVRVVPLAFLAYTALYLIAFMNFTWTNPDGAFSARPDVMIRYFVDQPHRWLVWWEVYYTHSGPLAWSMPGP